MAPLKVNVPLPVLVNAPPEPLTMPEMNVFPVPLTVAVLPPRLIAARARLAVELFEMANAPPRAKFELMVCCKVTPLFKFKLPPEAKVKVPEPPSTYKTDPVLKFSEVIVKFALMVLVG